MTAGYFVSETGRIDCIRDCTTLFLLRIISVEQYLRELSPTERDDNIAHAEPRAVCECASWPYTYAGNYVSNDVANVSIDRSMTSRGFTCVIPTEYLVEFRIADGRPRDEATRPSSPRFAFLSRELL